MKTLVLGLGNPLISDDSVGLRVAARLSELLADRDDVEVEEDYWGGLRLMERMAGYEYVVVVDAICTGEPPGTIHLLKPDAVPTQRSASTHDVNLPTALAFGRQHGVELPSDENILLVGIEAEDVLTFCDRCTPHVQAAIPKAVEEVLRAVSSIRKSKAT
jgi:hydrogenase maturation protease